MSDNSNSNTTSSGVSVSRSAYQLLTGTHGQQQEDGSFVIYRPIRGKDRMMLTESEAAKLGSRVRKLDEAIVAPTKSGETIVVPNEPTDWSFVADQSAADVIALINSLDNPDEIDAIHTVEKGAKARQTVLAAAEKRHAQLTEGE